MSQRDQNKTAFGFGITLHVRALQVLGMRIKPYVPDFSTAFQHFCIHPGGRAVIEEVSADARRSMFYVHA